MRPGRRDRPDRPMHATAGIKIRPHVTAVCTAAQTHAWMGPGADGPLTSAQSTIISACTQVKVRQLQIQGRVPYPRRCSLRLAGRQWPRIWSSHVFSVDTSTTSIDYFHRHQTELKKMTTGNPQSPPPGQPSIPSVTIMMSMHSCRYCDIDRILAIASRLPAICRLEKCTVMIAPSHRALPVIPSITKPSSAATTRGTAGKKTAAVEDAAKQST